MYKVLIILRGVSGAGKSTAAEVITEPCFPVVEADMYHYVDGVYEWKPENIAKAHKWCQDTVEGHMKICVPKITVSNTSTTEKELEPYLNLAEKYGYQVVTLVVENRHGNDSIHDVPQETRNLQEQRLRGSLKLQ